MYRGKRLKGKCQVWNESGQYLFSKSSGNPIFGQIFGHQRAKNEVRDTKMNNGQETHPMKVNARYEMNWANSFFKHFRKACLQMDGRTDRRTDRHRGESTIPPFHLQWSGGIIKAGISYYISGFMWGVITQTYPLWFNGFIELSLKLGLTWVIKSYWFICMQLLIHSLISMF